MLDLSVVVLGTYSIPFWCWFALFSCGLGSLMLVVLCDIACGFDFVLWVYRRLFCGC